MHDEEAETNDDIIDDLDQESVLRNSNEKQNQFNRTDTEKNNNPIDEHSEIDEIEGTTTLSILDNLNVTFPSLSRIVGIEEDGDDENNILNSTNKHLNPIDENIANEDEIDNLNHDNLDDLSNDFTETNLLRSPSNEECGRNRFNNLDPMTERIIGGSDTIAGEVPWIASVRLTHPKLGPIGHLCMGVLISRSWVATASHCIINTMFSLTEPKYWQVRLGKHNIRKKEQNEKTYQVVKMFQIKNYAAYDNDLALLKLEVPVEINEFIRTICLPPHDKFDFSYRECYVSGWGKIDSQSLKRNAEILRKVKVNIYDNLDCHRVYYPRFKISIKNWHVCAGNKLGNAGTCHGDSGSPLQCKINNRFYLFGITSFGSNCAKPNFPDVYSKVTYFLKWIQDKIKNE